MMPACLFHRVEERRTYVNRRGKLLFWLFLNPSSYPTPIAGVHTAFILLYGGSHPLLVFVDIFAW